MWLLIGQSYDIFLNILHSLLRARKLVAVGALSIRRIGLNLIILLHSWNGSESTENNKTTQPLPHLWWESILHHNYEAEDEADAPEAVIKSSHLHISATCAFLMISRIRIDVWVVFQWDSKNRLTYGRILLAPWLPGLAREQGLARAWLQPPGSVYTMIGHG